MRITGKRCWAIWGIVLAAGICGGIAAAEQCTGNIFQNGDFEITPDTAWTQTTTGAGIITDTPADANSPTHYALFGGTGITGFQATLANSEQLDVAPGVYTQRADLYKATGAVTSLAVNFWLYIQIRRAHV